MATDEQCCVGQYENRYDDEQCGALDDRREKSETAADEVAFAMNAVDGSPVLSSEVEKLPAETLDLDCVERLGLRPTVTATEVNGCHSGISGTDLDTVTHGRKSSAESDEMSFEFDRGKIGQTTSGTSSPTDLLSELKLLEVTRKQRQDMEFSTIGKNLDGLEHLNKLLSVVEHMEGLKEENRALQQKCTYLEDMKMLLKEQNILLLTEQPPELVQTKRPSKTWAKTSLGNSPDSGHHVSRSRDTTNARRQSLVLAHQQRSQSVGSCCELDLSQMEMEVESGGKPTISTPTEERKSLKLQEKWKQVKKVFSGKTESGGKMEVGAISAELLLKSNSKKMIGSGKRNNRSMSLSGGSSSSHSKKKNSVYSPKCQPLLDIEIPEHGQSLGITFENDMQDPMKYSGDSPKKPSVTSDSLSRNSCSEVPEEGSVFSPGEDTDDSTFTLWVHQTSPKRRQSSPLLNRLHQLREPVPDNSGTFLAVKPTPVHAIGRSSSFKVSKAGPEISPEEITSKSLPSTPIEPEKVPADAANDGHMLVQPDAGKKSKGTWGKVMDIFQNRRDSLKSRSGKADDDVIDIKDETVQSPGVGSGFVMSGSTKMNSRKLSVVPSLISHVSSPRIIGGGSPSLSASQSAGSKRYSLSSVAISSGSPLDLATLFGVNDDFTKKMQEWEEKKKSTTKSSTRFSEEFIRKMEEWEQKKGLGGSKPTGADVGSPVRVSPEGSGCPYSPQDGDDQVQIFLSESFSRTVQDWEEVRRRHSESKEKEKTKKKESRSVSRERDKSQQRIKKALKKIETKEQKLEQELAKLSQLRLKLDSQVETSSASEKTVGERHHTSQEIVKIEDWSSPTNKRRLCPNKTNYGSNSTPDGSQGREDGQKLSDGTYTEPVSPNSSSRRHQSTSLSPVSPKNGSRRHHSISVSQISLDSLSSIGSQSLGIVGMSRSRGGSLRNPDESHSGGRSSCLRMLSSPATGVQDKNELMICSRAEEELKQQIEEKEEEVTVLQNEVQQLTNQMNNMNKIYSETIEHFQRELYSQSRLGQQILHSEEVTLMLSQLGSRLDALQQYGDKITKEISQTQMKIAKEASNRRQTEQRLLQNLEQLHWIVESQSASCSLAEIIIHLCSYVTKLLSKTSTLRQCVSERNLLIQELERHLLVQEVINKLLQADVERRAAELGHLKEFQRLAIIKRWKTFNGTDSIGRDELFQSSPLSKVQEPIFPKIPQSCKKVQTLLAEMVSDPETTDIDIDWLTAIKTDAEHVLRINNRGPWTECFTSAATTNASVQTVMTFCDCDYIPPQLPSPSEPFRCIPNSRLISQLHPSYLSLPPHLKLSLANRKAISLDRYISYLLPDEDRYATEYKPRKSSAPEFLMDIGESAVWLKQSSFRPISSPYSDYIQKLEKQLLQCRNETKADAKPQIRDDAVGNNTLTSEQTLKQLVDRWNAVNSTIQSKAVFSGAQTSHKEKRQNVEQHGDIVDSDAVRDTHDSLRHNSQIWSTHSPKSDAKANQTNELVQNKLQENSMDCRNFVDSFVSNDVKDTETALDDEEDKVFMSPEESFWNSNIARLKETRIDESCYDIRDSSKIQNQSRLNGVTSGHDDSGVNSKNMSWSGDQDLETSGSRDHRFRKSSPIVVRKLKSATELMNDCKRKKMNTRTISLTDDSRTSSTRDVERVGRRSRPSQPTLFTMGASSSSIESANADHEKTRRMGNNMNSSVGSSRERFALRSNLLPTSHSETASPIPNHGKRFDNFKLVPVGSKGHDKPMVFPVSQKLSPQGGDQATGFLTENAETNYRSYTSSCSSISTMEMNPFCRFPTKECSSNVEPSYYSRQSGLEVETSGNKKHSRSEPVTSSRTGSSAAKKMCRALCLQAMSVELTDDSTDSSLSHHLSPPTSPSDGGLESQEREQEQRYQKSRGKWLQKPRKLFKSLK